MLCTLKSPLKKWRKSVGLSQTKLAELADVSQAHISKVENGMLAIEGNLKKYLEGVADLHNEQERFMGSG